MLLFEISWEICNKVGGINTTIASKIRTSIDYFKDNYILLGPYTGRNDNFIETKDCIINLNMISDKYGIKCYSGTYFKSDGPKVILIDYKDKLGRKLLEDISSYYSEDFFSENWNGLDSAFFGALSGFIINEITKDQNKKIVAHFHEWMCGSGILFLKMCGSNISTVFTTHATSFGRYLSKLDLELEDISLVDEQAKKMRIYTKHTLEKLSASYADCFTTVSPMVAKESKDFLGVSPDIITPNGIDQSCFSIFHNVRNKKIDKRDLFSILEKNTSIPIDKESRLIIYSGRCEFRNKGLDVLIETLAKIDSEIGCKVVFIGIILLQEQSIKCIVPPDHHYMNTHTHKEGICSITNVFLKQTMEFIKKKFHNTKQNNIKSFFIPMFVHPKDGFLNMNYFDLLSIADLSIFPSKYEPWGYTPQESVLCGVPTITTNKSGFGLWIKRNFSDTGLIYILSRACVDDDVFVENMKEKIKEILYMDKEILQQKKSQSLEIMKRMTWDVFFDYYLSAYNIACKRQNKHGKI